MLARSVGLPAMPSFLFRTLELVRCPMGPAIVRQLINNIHKGVVFVEADTALMQKALA